MILKDEKFEDIIDLLDQSIILIGSKKIEHCDQNLKELLKIIQDLSVNDLDISEIHLNAVIKKTGYSEETAKEYIISQLRDDILYPVIRKLFALLTYVYLETLEEEI